LGEYPQERDKKKKRERKGSDGELVLTAQGDGINALA